MDTLRGTVTNIRHTTDVHGSENVIATTHITIFDLAGTAVRFEGDTAASIDEGDEAAVAGYHRRGTFRALAFRNLTKKTDGSRLAATYFIIGLGLVLYGFFAVLLFQSLASVFWGMLGAGVGTVLMLADIRIWRARRTLQFATTGAHSRQPPSNGK